MGLRWCEVNSSWFRSQFIRKSRQNHALGFRDLISFGRGSIPTKILCLRLRNRLRKTKVLHSTGASLACAQGYCRCDFCVCIAAVPDSQHAVPGIRLSPRHSWCQLVANSDFFSGGKSLWPCCEPARLKSYPYAPTDPS